MYIVTGGGTGIGKAVAQSLADRQQAVLIVGRRLEPLQSTAGHSPLIEYMPVDLSGREGRDQLLEKIKDKQNLKGLINNAGTIHPITPALQITESHWDHALELNVKTPFVLTQALHPLLKDGRVLNIGSGAAYFPVAGWTTYCVSKAALSMLTKSFQLELDVPNVASVMPGIIDTDMQADIRKSKNMQPEKQAFFEHLKQDHLLIQPETVGIFLTWLLLDVDLTRFTSQEWDIYDKSHHSEWLQPPHVVPDWEAGS